MGIGEPGALAIDPTGTDVLHIGASLRPRRAGRGTLSAALRCWLASEVHEVLDADRWRC